MKRNTIKIIISAILVHLLAACTPTDFMGDGTANFNFEVTEGTNQQQSGQAEVVSVSFESQFLTVKEGEDVEVKIKLNKASGSDIFVRLNSAGGEAKIGEDLLIESSTIHVPKGSLTASFIVKALTDAKVEQSETFFGELEVFQKDLAMVASSSLSIILQDSAPVNQGGGGAAPIASLIAMSGAASEAQSTYQIPIVLDKIATQNVIVSIGVDAGSTATLGQDFIIQGGNSVTIPAGSQSGMLMISIIDDAVIENAPETISLSLLNAVNATIGAQKQFQLSIIDNDTVATPVLPIVSINSPAASISEAAGNYNLVVSLDKPATQAVTIQYAIQSQTATLGADFTVQGTSLTIPVGQQNGTIAISIINDTQVESTEIFNVTLSSATGATLSANRSFALSIIDNDAPQNNVDPLVSFASASGAASEAQGNYGILFTLSQASTQNITIMLTMSGSALQNQDFSLPMGDNIIIPAGATSASLPLVIIDDAINEQTENVVFTIASVTGGGAKVGAIPSFNFSIMDNDAPQNNTNVNLTAYTETLYNNIQRNQNTGRCFNCHRANGTLLQIAPYHSQDDPALALQTIESLGLVNLDNPAASRLVTKVEGGHYPWSGSSVEDAALIASYIQMWADRVKAAGNNGGGTPGNSNKISTNALLISEGQEIAGTARVTANQIGFWDFKKGADDKIIYDRSGIAPAINLDITGDLEWLGGQGIVCNANATNGKAMASAASSKKLSDKIKATNTYTFEAWVTSATKDQTGPTRIMSYSSNTALRNFTMGQEGVYYNFRNRNARTDNNGLPAHEPQVAKIGDRPATHHVVMVYDGKERKLYVDGAIVGNKDARAEDDVQALTGWNDGYRFLFCNEATNDRAFKGSIHLAAAHDKALSPAEIMQNYNAGFTKKLALEFDIAEHTNAGAKMSVQIEVSGSYVVANELKFSGLANNVNVSGIRFAVDGQEVAAGQAYTFLEKTAVPNAMVLSDVASMIEVPDLAASKISVNFQELGNKVMPVTTSLFPYEGDNTTVPNPEPTSPSTIRLFSEIYQTMSNITGVPASNAKTVAVYNEIKSGLPTDNGLDTFTSSHQINIIKLAYEYCNEMVDDADLRNAYFGNINTGQAINAATKAQIADAVSKKAIGRNVATQASDADVTQLVSSLVDEMVGFNKSTTDVLKGACVLGLGSMNNLVK